jgi:hypothetical protein
MDINGWKIGEFGFLKRLGCRKCPIQWTQRKITVIAGWI